MTRTTGQAGLPAAAAQASGDRPSSFPYPPGSPTGRGNRNEGWTFRLGKALRRLLSAIGWVVVALLVLYVCAPPLILPALVRAHGLPELERAFGSPLEVERVSVGYLGAVTLEGVTVHDPAGGEPMLVVARLEAQPDIPRLLAGAIQFHLVRLKEPLLRLRIHHDGTTNLDRAMAGLGIIAVEGVEAPGVEVDRLEVHAGRVLIETWGNDKTLGHPVSAAENGVRHPDVEVSDTTFPAWVSHSERGKGEAPSRGFSTELVGVEVMGLVSGTTQLSSLTGTARAFGGLLDLWFGVRGNTPDLPEGATRLSVGWGPAGPQANDPIALGPLEGVTSGEVTVDFGPGPLGAVRGRIEWRDARLSTGGTAALGGGASAQVQAAWLEVRPDIVFHTAAPLGSISGTATGRWRDARLEGTIGGGDGDTFSDLVDSLSLVCAGQVSAGLDRGRVVAVQAIASVRDAVLVQSGLTPAAAHRLRVPRAEVAADLSLDAYHRPAGSLQARADAIDLRAALALWAGDRFPGGPPRADGIVEGTARLAFEHRGALRLTAAGRVDAFRAGSQSEAPDAAAAGLVTFDLSAELDRQEEEAASSEDGVERSGDSLPAVSQPRSPGDRESARPDKVFTDRAFTDRTGRDTHPTKDVSGRVVGGYALVRGTARYTAAGVALGPVLAEADRLRGQDGRTSPAVVRLDPFSAPVAGLLDGWGTVDLERDAEGPRVAVVGAGVLRRPRLGGRPIGPDACRVEALYDLHLRPTGDGLAGQARLTGRSLDLPAALAVLGAPEAAGRCDGSIDVHLTVDADKHRLRIHGDLTGDGVEVALGDRRLAWERVHAGGGLLVAWSGGQVDVETATFSAAGVEARMAGRLERDPDGRWRGGLNGLVRAEGAALLERLRGAGLDIPAAVHVTGTIPLDAEVSFGDAVVRVSGRGHPANRAALAWGRFVRIDPGTPSDLRFAVTYESTPRLVRVEGLSVALPGVTGELKGLLDLGQGTADLSGAAKVSDAAAARQLCPAVRDLDVAGRLALRARLAGPLQEPALSAAVHLDDLSLGIGEEADEGLRVTGAMRLDGCQVALDEAVVTWRGDALRVSGTADLSPGRHPSAHLRVTGERLRLDQAGGGAGPPERRPRAGAGDARAVLRALADVDATVTALIDRVDLDLLSLDALSTTVRVAEGKLHLDPAVALLESGAASGLGVIDLLDTEPALRLDWRAIGVRPEGRLGDFVREKASLLHLTGVNNLEGSLAFPVTADADGTWPVGELRAVCRGGRIQGPPGPEWLPRLFNGLRLDRYPFRAMSVRAVFEGGEDVRLVAFFDAGSLPDLVVEVRATAAGTLRVDVGVDLFATASPTPELFQGERPYVVSIYRSQEAWVGGRRVLHAGGFRTATEVSYDLLVRRNAVVQALGSVGGELARFGLLALDTVVPLRAIEEILGGRWWRPAGRTPPRGQD